MKSYTLYELRIEYTWHEETFIAVGFVIKELAKMPKKFRAWMGFQPMTSVYNRFWSWQKFVMRMCEVWDGSSRLKSVVFLALVFLFTVLFTQLQQPLRYWSDADVQELQNVYCFSGHTHWNSMMHFITHACIHQGHFKKNLPVFVLHLIAFHA